MKTFLPSENKIQRLTSSVVDQIAAGEVVERPAGLVKELIENSLDAGAKTIEIQFSNGGLFVCVKDDGCGIEPEELSLALSRHATSKIKKAGDLFSIQSYGFRGEALASIASISCLTLISKIKNLKSAYRLKSEFGKTMKLEKLSGTQGTTVIVDRVFQNVSARLRFLKSESVETLAVKNVIVSQALSRPDVSFRVIHKGRLLSYWPRVSSARQRAETILSISPLYHHVHKEGEYSVEAVLSAPNNTARTSKKMWFFVNGRAVEDKTLYGALMSAHRNLLMHGEYPIAVLYLTMPPVEVDVNVHPTKTRVRFRNQSKIFKFVQSGARALLEKGPWLTHLAPSYQELIKEGKNNPRQSRPVFASQEKLDLKTNLNQEDGKKPLKPKEFRFEAKPSFVSALTAEKLKRKLNAGGINAESSKESFNALNQKQRTFSSLRVLAQAKKTYIVAQSESSLVFVDQHAAHERILFEKLISFFKKGRAEQQKYLTPLKIKMDPAEVLAAMQAGPAFKTLGIEIKSSRSDEVLILSSPSFIKESVIERAIKQWTAEHIERGESFTAEKIVSDISASMACHSAIRAGQTLSLKEMESLLEQMEGFSFSSFCPHGRPVFVEYPFSRLERDFGRVV